MSDGRIWLCMGCNSVIQPENVIMHSLTAQEGGHAVPFAGRETKLMCGPVRQSLPPAGAKA